MNPETEAFAPAWKPDVFELLKLATYVAGAADPARCLNHKVELLL
jgi:hypothetical protein